MKKYVLPLFCGLAAMAITETRAQNFGLLSANNFECSVTSTGGLFWLPESMTNACEVPQGSGVHPIFASHLWMGGITSSNQMRVAAEMYNAGYSEWFPGPLKTDGSASTTAEVMEAYDRVWIANGADVAIHVAYTQAVQNGTVGTEFPNGYTIPEWMFDWPAHGDFMQDYAPYLAPFFDHDLDGVYDPQAGDYPMFCGDYCIYFIFNDSGGLHATSGGLAIGVEVHGMLYAYEDTGDANLDNTVFVSYKIINRGNQTLTESHVAMFSDFELPQEYIGTNVHRAAVYGYHGDTFDENGYGSDAGIIAMSILAGPWADMDELDNPLPDDILSAETNSYGRFGWGFGDGFPDNERLGMSQSMYFTNGPGPNGDPAMTMHFYRYMTGFWKDSSSLLYGGNGMASSGATEPCKYVFPGDSDPLITGTNGLELSGWTEEAAGNIAGDRRGLAASGPFTLNPQDVHYLDVAFVFARQSEGEQSLTETLNERLKETKLYFNQNLVDCQTSAMSVISVAEVKGSAGFEIFPNPSSEAVSVRWTNRADLLTLTDASGREVMRQNASGKSQASLDVRNLPRGIYLLRLSGQSDSRVTKLVVEK